MARKPAPQNGSNGSISMLKGIDLSQYKSAFTRLQQETEEILVLREANYLSQVQFATYGGYSKMALPKYQICCIPFWRQPKSAINWTSLQWCSYHAYSLTSVVYGYVHVILAEGPHMLNRIEESAVIVRKRLGSMTASSCLFISISWNKRVPVFFGHSTLFILPELEGWIWCLVCSCPCREPLVVIGRWLS